MQSITGNWPTVATANCSFSQVGPTGSCTVLDTALLGSIWIFASIGSLLFRIGAGLYLLVQVSSIFTFILQIPVVGPILGTLGPVMFAIYAFSRIRGTPSDL